MVFIISHYMFLRKRTFFIFNVFVLFCLLFPEAHEGVVRFYALLKIMRCYIALYYVKIMHVRLGVIKIYSH